MKSECTSVGILKMEKVFGKVSLVSEYAPCEGRAEWYRIWEYEHGGKIIETNGDPVFEDEERFNELVEQLEGE